MLRDGLRDAFRTVRTWPLFAGALLLTLAAAGLQGLMVGLMALRMEQWLPGPFAEMGHFTQAHHRIHDLTFAFLFVPPVLGVLAQFRRPADNVAGMLMTLVPGATLALVLVLTLAGDGTARVLQPPWLLVLAAALLATAVHPAGREFFRSFRDARLSWVMAALVAVAAIPLLQLAVTNITLQATVPDDHAAAGHYGFMAAFALTTIAVGILASLRPTGWTVTAWAAGLLPVLLGTTSTIYPHAASSLSLPWALAAIAWGAAFTAVALLTRSGQRTLSATTVHVTVARLPRTSLG